MDATKQKKRRRRRCSTGILAADITREQLARWFHLPSHQACARLGVSLSVLKRVCRMQGIPRWPYRAVPLATGQDRAVPAATWQDKAHDPEPDHSCSTPASATTPPTAATDDGPSSSASDHGGPASPLPSSSCTPSSPRPAAAVGEAVVVAAPPHGAKTVTLPAYGRRHADPKPEDSYPRQPPRKEVHGPARLPSDGLDALLAAAAAMEPSPEEASFTSDAGVAAVGGDPGLAFRDEDWACSCLMAAAQVQHPCGAGCPKLPSGQPGWGVPSGRGRGLLSAGTSLDPPSPAQEAERPPGQESLAAARPGWYSLQQRRGPAGVLGGQGYDQLAWPGSSSSLLGAARYQQQRLLPQLGAGPRGHGTCVGASGSSHGFQPSWAALQQLQQLQQRQLCGTATTGQLPGSAPAAWEAPVPAPPAAASERQQPPPPSPRQPQWEAEQGESEKQQELSLDPMVGIASTHVADMASWNPPPASNPDFAFASSDPSPAAWHGWHTKPALDPSMEAAADLRPTGHDGPVPAGSGPAGTACVGHAPPSLEPEPWPHATALVRLLETGLDVMQSQPNHPLAGQLAVAMRNAARALALSAGHMEM